MTATLSLALFLLKADSPSSVVSRDDYGVPHIRAADWRAAMVGAGYACAQDRLWQMEQSRRIARGKAAEAFGQAFVASDTQMLKFGYLDEELDAQIARQDPRVREAFDAYAEGVNAFIDEATKGGTLPEGYTENGFRPQPWTTTDSAAISVWMLQQFGRGGAGEIRNWALLQYLATRPNKDKSLDLFDDLVWQNDPKATVTVADEDLPKGPKPTIFPPFDRKTTQRHLAELPKLSLFELMPGIRVAERRETLVAAEKVAAPFKTGSYCVVVSPKRSSIQQPILLSAPQMGFRNPSVVHEMSLDYGSGKVVGMDIPGVPGIVIGHTEDLAWGLTTGVADAEDVAFGQPKTESIKRNLAIKDKPSVEIEQIRCDRGPIIIRSTKAKTDLIRVSSFYKKELDSISAIYGLYASKSVKDVQTTIQRATMNFNVFYALKSGDVGYEYAGLIPVRKPGYDPRLPIPFDQVWSETLPKTLMPRVANPKSGLIANWNNKPVSWWQNGDTPVWGSVFRDRVLRDQLVKPVLSPFDVERAAWSIARTSNDFWALKPYLDKLSDASEGRLLRRFDGMTAAGSIEAAFYTHFLDGLRTELFDKQIGNLMDPNNFRQAVQPSLIVNALDRRTRVDYLAGRSTTEVVDAAAKRAFDKMNQRGPFGADWGYRPGEIPVPGEKGIPYSDRGTYIQLIEFRNAIVGRNVLPPGVAESGPHSKDQANLSRSWTYKPMGF